MPVRKVSAHARSAASADQAWAVVRDFCAPWHPAIAEMVAEEGGQVRRFTTKGESTIYRERLTWFSDSERSMGYRLLEGIEGCERYDGRLTITSTEGGCAISMSANLNAIAARADDIAAGTQAVFDAGVLAIDAQALDAIPVELEDPTGRAELSELEVDDLPRLGLTHGGEKSDVLVLFLHGIGGNRTNWSAQLAVLASRYKVAALDLRGYGGSSLGAEQSGVEDYCADIMRVAELLGAKKLVLVGLSYGAWIATSFAMRHAEMLAGLVLSGGCTGMSEAGKDEREAFRLSREVPLNEGQTPADFAPSVVDVIAGPEASDAAREALLASMRAIPSETYADALRCFTNPLERFDFSRISMPVLLMTGEHDRLAPPAEIKSVAERIWDAAPEPTVRFEVIWGAGHVCNLEKPERYNVILNEFLGGLSR